MARLNGPLTNGDLSYEDISAIALVARLANVNSSATSPHERQELLTSWARLAHGKHHDAAFLQASLLFVVRAFAAGGHSPNGQPQLAMALAEAAAAAASHGDRWAFDAVLDVLAVRFRSSFAAKTSSNNGIDTAQAAAALSTLAKGVHSNQQASLAMCKRLLIMHNNAASNLLSPPQQRSAEHDPALAAAALRQLTPALAMAVEGASRGVAAHSSQELLPMLRRYWLLSALLDRQWGSRGGSDGRAGPQDWHAAQGRLAVATPELAPSSGSAIEAARIEGELAPQLRRLGPRGQLQHLQGVVEGLGGVLHDKSASLAAHLAATAALHLARVQHAPLPLLQQTSSVPFTSLLRHMQVMPESSSAHDQLAAITEASFRAYLARLQRGGGSSSSSQDVPRDLAACQGALAVELAALLSPDMPPHQAKLVQRWLQQALSAFPWLRWHTPLSRQLSEVWEAGAEGPQGTKRRSTPAAAVLRQVVAEGAARAPYWADATQAAAGGPDSHGAALRHCIPLLGELEGGAARSPLRDLAGPITGIEAVHAKAMHRGRVQGAHAAARAEGKPPSAVIQGVLQRLQHALAAEQPALEPLDDALSMAAAAVIAAPEGHADELRPLVSLLAWVPARVLTPPAARSAAFAWFWVAAEAPACLVQLLGGIMDALVWTSQQRLGVFSTDFSPSAFVLDSEGDSIGGVQRERSMVRELKDGVPALEAHHTWLLFMLELWQVVEFGQSPQHRAARAVLQRGLLAALADGRQLSQHPAAAGAVYRLLLLALQTAGHAEASVAIAAQLKVLVLTAALRWFSAVPAWYGCWSEPEAREQARAVRDFAAMVDNTWGRSGVDDARVSLLRLLLQVEGDRLDVWAAPVGPMAHGGESPYASLDEAAWGRHAATAWQVDPQLLLALQQRFPSVPTLQLALADLVRKHANDRNLQAIPEAAVLLASERNVKSGAAELAALERWAPAPLLEATALLAGASGSDDRVRAYALRSLTDASRPEEVAFFLPQLVQQLRADRGGLVERFLLHAASRSVLFAHLLLCALKTEGTPPEEAFNPTVKRSGWQPPRDTGLWAATDAVRSKVWGALEPPTAEHLKAELELFTEVTAVSGRLYQVPKPERKAAAAEILRDVKPSRNDLYLPVNAHARVLDVIATSATPMQSAAKVPILVAFQVELQERLADGVPRGKEQTTQACIFKVGDDCRQDILALQVIGLLKEAFEKAGLQLPMAPYGVIATDYECGIIEVVPDCQSRSALGETCDGGLVDIFARDFGPPGSKGFETARNNFLRSEAGYAIASYLLNIKDRHNGNIMIDKVGHLVHIDFGFILEISPGGNLGFESAPFKLSHEMTQLLDPGGHQSSPDFLLFEELCIRAFLAARGVADGIMATVELMAASGLPCFGRGKPVENLRGRFRLDLTDAQAAAYMRKLVQHAYNKWTTGFYDYVQYVQNAIPK